MKTIYVKFEKYLNQYSKEYAFLYPYTGVAVGSRITSPKYDSPMIVTRITNCSDSFQNGMVIKQIVINTINGQKVVEQSDSRTVSITIEQAREWYHSDNLTLKALALSAYNGDELELDYNYIANHTERVTTGFLTPVDSVDKIRVYCKLEMVAKHFNGDWKKTTDNKGYFISKTSLEKGIVISEGSYTRINSGTIYFKNRVDAETALEILSADINSLFQ